MAISPRLHVFVTFMLQFIVVIGLLGGVVPWLHSDKGLPWVVLVPAAIAGLVVLHFLISVLGGLFPVKCRQCQSPSRYHGFGWWPFTYRYLCPQCGTQMRYEIASQ